MVTQSILLKPIFSTFNFIMPFNSIIGEIKTLEQFPVTSQKITFCWILNSLPTEFLKTVFSITGSVSAFLHILKICSTLFLLCTTFDNQHHQQRPMADVHNMHALLTCQITENAQIRILFSLESLFVNTQGPHHYSMKWLRWKIYSDIIPSIAKEKSGK